MATLSVARVETVSLRQWIKGAVGSLGGNSNEIADAASSTYITASLKIAISLAEQIGRAEKLASFGVYRDLDVLPNRDVKDWADCVRIRLKAKENENHGARQNVPMKRDEELDLRPLPFAADIHGGVSASGWEQEYDKGMNDQLITLLESLDEPALPAADERTKSFEPDQLDYLNVESAELWSPESEPDSIFNDNHDTAKATLHRIYSLGLVFYELFSEGEIPPPGLMNLVASDEAFVSLPLSDGSDDENCASGPKRRHSSASHVSGAEIGVCQSSFEYLKLMGLPEALCSLIFNMLDSIHGEFSGNECYANIVDVASDLQLMVDKPCKFLRDLDLHDVSLSGLQLNENVFSRQEEFASIQSCYRRSISESCELAVISGESGTGKSWLAQRVGNFIAEEGGVVLSGKFDQMKQAKPFSALASAFDQYCDMLIREKDSDWAKLVVCNLRVAVGDDAIHLTKILPKLSQIMTRDSIIADSARDQNCLNALQRLCYSLCLFVETISRCSIVSVTLFMDDVQWADEASIAVLNRLLMKGHRKFFFVGCCRDDEMCDEHPFWNMIQNVRAFGINTTIVELSCMTNNTLNEMVSELLCLPPRLVRSLSDILHKKTKGNPLFFSQLIMSLNQDGLLRLSLSRGRWVWDEEEIQSIKLPENVALCFTKGISKLPLEVQSALRTLSMFGASIKCKYIQALESQLNVKLMEPLKVAASEGLVSNLKGSFHFCHDRIQEASYAMIEKQDRCRDHMMFGLCLVKLSLNTADFDMLFMAVNQVNLGGPSAVLDDEQSAIMAKYNLVAGKRAMEMSDFSSAHNFFSYGMVFLPDNHWANHYQLSLELFELGSQTALATGNFLNLGNLCGEVLRHSHSFEDKLNIYFTIISSLGYASQFSEAFEKGRNILSRLGEDIPSDPSTEALNQHIQKTQSLIRGISENEFLNYRLMTDNNKLAAMKLLSKMQTITVIAKPTVNPFVTLKMVQLTILHGMSPVSPIGFAYFGSLLGKLGNIQLGHKFTLLAKRVLHKLDAKNVAGEVIGAGIELQCFMEPLLAANERRVEGESAAMMAGDVQWACLNRMLYCFTLLWGGINLSAVHEAMSKACRFMKEQGHRTSLFIMLTGQKTAMTLMGNKLQSLAHEEHSTSVQDTKNPHHRLILSFHNLYRSFMLNDDCAVREYAKEFFELEKSSWCMFSGSIVQTFISGLAAFQIYRRTNDSVWAERGISRKAEMKLWAEQGSSWNFKQKFLLMQAEEHYSNGNLESAQDSYTQAAEYAKAHKCINDEALACELAAKFYLETCNLMSSAEHFKLAHEKYIHWGALGKAERLFAYTKEKFTILGDTATPPFLINSKYSDSQGFDEMDPRKRRAI